MMADGMKKGEIRRGPPSRYALCSRSMTPNPPMPEAMKTPTRGASCGVMLKPESRIANSDAAMAYWMNASIFLTSFLSMNARGSNPFTSPAMCVENCATSKRVMVAMPLQPRRSAFQFASVPMPTEDTSPIPVITTRLLTSASTAARRAAPRFRGRRYFLPFEWPSMYSTASLTRVIFSASSSGISIPNSSSKAITSSTVSSESAPRSSTNEASAVTSSSSTPSCSTMMAFTLSATAIRFLLGVHPAVHGQNVSSNIRRLVRGKKAHGMRDIRGCAEPAEGDLRLPVAPCGVRQPLGHVGLDQPGRHPVHGNATRPDFPRHRLAEANQPSLGRRVVRLPGVAHLADDGADGNDPPRPLAKHGLECGLA